MEAADHDATLEFTVTVDVPPAAVGESVVGLTESVGVTPSCVIVTVLVKEPAVKVTVTVLEAIPVFGASVAFTVPLFVPLEAESVAHDLSEATVHATLEVTVSVFDSPAAATLVIAAGATEIVGVTPSWVIVTVLVKEPAVKVSVTVLGAVPVFGASVTFTVPLFVPLGAESVAQDAELATVQFVLEATFTPALPPAAGTLTVDAGVAESVGAGGLTVTRQEASWFPSTVRTLIVVVPAASAFTVIEGPEVLLIEAFPGSLVDQITALFVAVAGRTVALSVKLFPISKVLLDSLSVTLVTGVVVTRGVILNVYLLSPPGVPSAKSFPVPSYISATKVVAPLA